MEIVERCSAPRSNIHTSRCWEGAGAITVFELEDKSTFQITPNLIGKVLEFSLRE